MDKITALSFAPGPTWGYVSGPSLAPNSRYRGSRSHLAMVIPKCLMLLQAVRNFMGHIMSKTILFSRY